MVNLISADNLTNAVVVVEEIKNMEVEMRYSNISGDYLGVQDGDVHYYSEDVFFNVTMERGTHITYTWNMDVDGAGTIIVVDGEPYVSYTYPAPGVYTVSVEATNEAGQSTQLFTNRHILRQVRDVKISTNSPSPQNMTFEVYVDTGNIGTHACYLMDFVDDAVTYGERYLMRGLKEDCLQHFSEFWLNDQTIDGALFIELTEAELVTTADTSTDGRPNMTLTVTMNTIGEHTIKLTAANNVSKLELPLDIRVTRGICVSPIIALDELNHCDHACDPQGIRMVKKSEDVLTRIQVTLKCVTSTNRTLDWHVYKVNEDGVASSTPHTLPCADQVKQHVGILDPAGTFKIPKRCLEYGLYKISVNATMTAEEGIWAVSDTYVRIVKTDLKASFRRGIDQVVKWNSNFTFDGYNFTYDPDVEQSDKSGITGEWFCRRCCETMNVEITESGTVVTDVSTGTCNVTTLYDKDGVLVDDGGGCLKTDEQELPGKLDMTGLTANFDTFNFREGDCLKLTMIVKKDTRYQRAVTSVEVMNGDPPEGDVLCVTNCRDKYNPTSKFALSVKIAGFRRGMLFNFQWSLYMKNLTTEEDELVPYDLWKDSAEGTGVDQDNIALGNFFGGYFNPDLDNEKIPMIMKCKVQRQGSPPHIYGRVARGFIVNNRPKAGECHITPPSGLAQSQKFNVECTKPFEDEDFPLTYTLLYYYEGQWKMVYTGPTTYIDVGGGFSMPPIVASGQTKTVDFKLDAQDSIGSVTSIQMSMELEGPPMEEMLSAVAELDLDTLATSGDPMAVTQAASLMAAVFASSDSTTSTEPAPPAEPVPGEPAPEPIVETPEEQAARIAEEERLAEEERRKRAESRAKVAEALSNLPIESPSDAGLALTALASVTSKPDENNAETQDLALKLGDSVLEMMSSKTGDEAVPFEELAQQTGNLLAVMGNVMASASMQAEASVDAQSSASTADESSSGSASETGSAQTTEVESAAEVERKAKETLDRVNKMVDTVTALLSESMVAGEKPTIVSPPGGSLTLELWKEFTRNIEQPEVGGFTFPQSAFGDGGNTSAYYMTAQNTQSKTNPYSYVKSNATKVSTPVASFRWYDEFNDEMPIKDLEDDIELIMNRDAAAFPLDFMYGETQDPTAEKFDTIHLIQIFEQSSIHINVEFFENVTEEVTTGSPMTTEGNMMTTEATNSSMDDEHQWLVIGRWNQNPTNTEFDFNCTLPLSDDELNSLIQLYSPGSFLNNTDKIPSRYTCFYDNNEFNITEEAMLHMVVINNNGTQEPIGYNLSVYTTQCVYWDNDTWASDGCRVGPLTTTGQQQCLCNHLTSFSGSFVVPMNTFDPSDSAFLKLAENPLVFAVMVSIMCIYVLLCIWARRQDKRDELLAGATPLLDNNPSDKYLYELIIYTGARKKECGTTSKVNMIMSGEFSETEPRLIYDDKRPVLKKGSVDAFLLASPEPLGALTHIRIWHDNSGKSPSWFFDRMQVTDLQTNNRFFFMCHRWLAVEEDDGLIDRVIPVAGKEELTNFSHLFWTKTRKDLTDGHIWFSVFQRPPRSRFTRIQRLTCCLCLLFSAMMASILFYKGDEQTPGTQVVRIGPIELTPQMIYVGVVSSLIALPANIIIATLFRYSEAPPENACCKKKKEKPEDAAQQHTITVEEAQQKQMELELMKQRAFIDGESDSRELVTPRGQPSRSNLDQSYPSPASDHFQPDADQSYESVRPIEAGYRSNLDEPEEPEKKKTKKPFLLPYWCIYISYVLSFCVVGASFYVTVEIAGVFGADKALKWFTAFCLSIVESIFLSQPIKVLLLAGFYSLVIRKPDTEGDPGGPDLKKNEEWLHRHFTEEDMKNPETAKLVASYKSSIPEPPDEEYLQEARATRFKEMKMNSLLWEIAFYFVFLYLMMVVAYANRDPKAFAVYTNFERMMVTNAYNDEYGKNTWNMLTIRTAKMFWEWSENSFFPGLYDNEFYDGQRHTWLKGFTADLQTFLVGEPRFRLLRIKPRKCPSPVDTIMEECREPYSIFNQDEEDYQIGWVPRNDSIPNWVPDARWMYKEWDELEGYPIWGQFGTYSGGGYSATFGRDMNTAMTRVKELRENGWIDRYTRAVAVEYLVYNANVNLYGTSSTLIEFTDSGGAFTTYKFYVMRLSRYVGPFGYIVLGAEIIVACFILYFIICEAKKFKKQKKEYFKVAWNVYEVFVLSFSVATIVMFFYRLLVGIQVGNKIAESPQQFHNFQYAVFWDEMYTYMIGCVVSLSTFKCLKLLRFNKRMSLLSSTLRYAAKPIFTFVLMFMIVFVAFGLMAYVVFQVYMEDFATFIATLETLFSAMLNKFRFRDMKIADRVFGPTILFTFSLCVTFILVNVFVTVIIEAFAVVKDDLSQQSNEYELVDFMVDRFKILTGLGEVKRQPPKPKRKPKAREYEDYVDEMDIDPELQRADDMRRHADHILNKLNYMLFFHNHKDGDTEDFVEGFQRWHKKSRQGNFQ